MKPSRIAVPSGSADQMKRLETLQALRAIAALLVLVSHIRHKVQVFNPDAAQFFNWFDIGVYGVDIFFVISGYIIARSAADEGPLSGGRFLVRRMARILPLYWLVTVVALGVWLYDPNLVNSSAPRLTRLVESVFLLPQDGRYLVQSAWTLVYEMYFYVLFAVTLTTGRLQRIILPGLLVAGAMAGLIWPQPGPESATLPLITSRHLFEFAAGYVLATRFGFLHGRSASLGVGLFAVGAAMILLRAGSDNDLNAWLYWLGVPAMLLVAGAMAMEGWFVLPRGLVELGDASYSLYLTHGFVVAAGAIGWNAMFVITPVGSLIFAAAMIAASWLVALECYARFEKPAGRWLNRKLAADRRTERAGMAPAE